MINLNLRPLPDLGAIAETLIFNSCCRVHIHAEDRNLYPYLRWLVALISVLAVSLLLALFRTRPEAFEGVRCFWVHRGGFWK